jgi:S-adenosylmethionine:tRNA ribosyltransferase-isomerase
VCDLQVANSPPELRGGRRSSVRMMLSNRLNQTLYDYEFESIPILIHPGDVLVFNLSATLPAEVEYGSISVRYYDFHDKWCRISATMTPPDGTLRSYSLQLLEGGPTVGYETKQALMRHLFTMGRMVHDTQRVYPPEYYRSVFSAVPGSAEFPSAARPFTLELVHRLMRKGAFFGYITLHTATQLEGEKPLPEYFMVPYETISLIEKARMMGRRVLAVGTTCTRALESVDLGVHTPRGVEGYTQLIIDENHRLKSVDGLITGFHDPESSHYELLKSFQHPKLLEKLYREACRLGYRKGAFGDLCLLL